jgi:hypothetical protein
MIIIQKDSFVDKYTVVHYIIGVKSKNNQILSLYLGNKRKEVLIQDIDSINSSHPENMIIK